VAELDTRLEAARGEIWGARADLAELESVILSTMCVPGQMMAPPSLVPGLFGGL
jgi:hypothetical protein